MKTTRIFGKDILNKCFSKMTPAIKTILMSLLMIVAEQQSYLEEKSKHADAIGWYLGKIHIDEFIKYSINFFTNLLKYLKKLNLGKVAIAFDKTHIVYYGKIDSLWINSYNNNVKGATGSIKFMVCSLVLSDKRFVLFSKPIHRGEYTEKVIDQMLFIIKKYLQIEMNLCDRGFFSKNISSIR